jgi:hypothetical protein
VPPTPTSSVTALATAPTTKTRTGSIFWGIRLGPADYSRSSGVETAGAGAGGGGVISGGGDLNGHVGRASCSIITFKSDMMVVTGVWGRYNQMQCRCVKISRLRCPTPSSRPRPTRSQSQQCVAPHPCRCAQVRYSQVQGLGLGEAWGSAALGPARDGGGKQGGRQRARAEPTSCVSGS